MFKKKKSNKITVLLLIITNNDDDNDDDEWIKSYSCSEEQHFVFLDNYYLIKLICSEKERPLDFSAIFESFQK